MRTFATQLDADLQIVKGEGTHFAIEWPWAKDQEAQTQPPIQNAGSAQREPGFKPELIFASGKAL